MSAGVRSFPQPLAPVQQESNPLLKNLKTTPTREFIGEQKLGTKVFGATVVDYDNLPSFFQFYTSNPSKTTTKLSNIENPKAAAPVVSMTGTWAGDGYYAELVKVYSYTYRLKGWAKVDPTTGDFNYIVDDCMDSSNGYGRFTFEEGGKYYFIYDMMWDPTTDTIYGFAYPEDYSADNNHFATQFGEIDKNTGEFDPVYCFDNDVYYQSGAFDYDGNLYAMRYDIKTNEVTTTDEEGNTVTSTVDVFNGAYLCKIDLNTYKEEKIGDVITKDGAKYLPLSQVTMDFDHTTGDLYMGCLPLAEGATSASGPTDIFRLNVDNGEAEYLGSLNAAETMTGMYISYFTADSRTAPAQVADLTAVGDPNGTNAVTLSWTNPTTAWNRSLLTNLTKVAIARDTKDNIIATVDATGIGQAQTFVDENATQGLHDYYVMAQCKDGENGVPAKITVWAGYDYAAAPTNITIEKVGDNGAKITWDAPTAGSSEGYIDTANMTYTVTRYPDKVVVAEGLTAREFSDTAEAIESYYYGIKAVTPAGDGVEGFSERLVFGSVLNPPYECKMESVDDAAAWLVFDGATSYQYSAASCFASWDTGIECPWQGIKFSVSSRRNDFFIVTPDISVKEGKQYRLTMQVYYHYMPTIYTPTIHHDFSLVAGKGVDASTYTKIYSQEDYRPESYYTVEEWQGIYTADYTGKCNFGYYEYTSNMNEDDVDFVSVKYCLVEELQDNDLAAVEITGPAAAPVNAASDYTVAVRNEGRSTISDYTVQVVRKYEDFEIVLGETQVKNQPINNLETTYIKVAATPDIEGTCDLYGKVVYADDPNADNDLSPALSVEVLPEGSVAFNYEVNGDNAGVDTSIPMSWYKSASICQSIYPTDIHGIAAIDGNDKVTIHGVGYKYKMNDGQKSDINSVAVKVYVGQTDKDVVASGDSYIDLSAQQLIFDGTVTLTYSETEATINFPSDVNNMFTFDPTKNLVVTVIRTDSGATGDTWPILWSNFHTSWSSDSYQTLYSNNISDTVGSTIAGYSTTVSPALPVLALAVNHSSGVDKVNDFTAPLAYNNLDHSLYVGEYADAEVAIYRLDGKLVMKTRANGTDPIALNLDNGIYIARVAAANGAASLKFSVK